MRNQQRQRYAIRPK